MRMSISPVGARALKESTQNAGSEDDARFQVYMHTSVCCHPIYSGRQTCGRTTSRGHTWGCSHRFNISPPSFGGTCREKDSAIPFLRRLWSRILCTHELIVLHLLGFLFCSVFFCEGKSQFVVRVEIRSDAPTSEGFKVANWTTGATVKIWQHFSTRWLRCGGFTLLRFRDAIAVVASRERRSITGRLFFFYFSKLGWELFRFLFFFVVWSTNARVLSRRHQSAVTRRPDILRVSLSQRSECNVRLPSWSWTRNAAAGRVRVISAIALLI